MDDLIIITGKGSLSLTMAHGKRCLAIPISIENGSLHGFLLLIAYSNFKADRIYRPIAKTPLQGPHRLAMYFATLTGVMCSTSQCELRSTFPNLRVTNVIRIVTYYTLPPLELPDSSWMTRSQRSRRRDKGRGLRINILRAINI